MKKLLRVWNTVKYLKLIQVYHQLVVRVLPTKPLQQYSTLGLINTKKITLIESGINPTQSLFNNLEFSFLNITHCFGSTTDWNFNKYGKLWTYNLNYFEYLNQASISQQLGENLINDFISKTEIIKDGFEPYPTSLRCINWIKFISKNKLANPIIDASIYTQYKFLANNLEYHLLGNHLLENAFSLLIGSYYFKDEQFYKKSNLLLKSQLNEQILNDGGHFELSPMYHKILLFRLLDSINLIANNTWQPNDLLTYLTEKAQLMLGWLEAITYSNGSTPNVNDSANGIAPSTLELVSYAKKLNLSWQEGKLKDSGYRLFREKNYELLVDVGNIGPDYIPGHAHADTFNFELIVNKNPIIIDTGISTYEKNERRQLERSTIAHNTVVVANKNQSDVWGGFRVGKRAKILRLEEEGNNVKALHNGYTKSGIKHSRSFRIEANKIQIQDDLESPKAINQQASALVHFHPKVNITLSQKTIQIENFGVKIIFANVKSIELKKFDYCKGFNQTITSTMAVIHFNHTLTTTILVE